MWSPMRNGKSARVRPPGVHPRPRDARRGVAVAAAFAIALSLLGGAAPVAATTDSIEGKRLVFITAGNQSEYQIAQGEWFKQFAEEEGASVSVIDGKFDPLAQLKGIEDSVAAGADGIIIQQVDPVVLVEAINTARATGTLVMSVGGLAHPDAIIPVGGTFNDEVLVREAAREAAAWLEANKPGEPARIVLFDIPSIIVCHEWRMVAFRDELINVLGEDNVVDVFNDLVPHTLDVVTAKMDDIIQSGADFNMFTACGATGAVGGLDALTRAGMARAVDGVPQDVWVLSIDATPAEVDYFVDPEVSHAMMIALTPKTNARVFLDNFKLLVSGEIGPDDEYVARAPGILFRKDDGCEMVNQTLGDEYAIIPGYWEVECP